MATTTQTSATSSGPCGCCGAGGTTCCPDGDPADSLCITFAAGDVNIDYFGDGGSSCSPWDVSYAGSSELTSWFDGQSFTLARTFDCIWEYTEAVAIGGHAYTRSVTAELADFSGTYRWRVLVQQTSGSTSAYSHRFETGAWSSNPACGADHPAAPGAATCLPVSYGEMFGSYSNGSGGRASWDGGFTLADGACGGEMAAAAAAVATPCRFEGDDLTGEERAARKLDHRKRWLRCGRPGFERFGLPVTDCRSCGPRASRRCGQRWCDGYEPGETA